MRVQDLGYRWGSCGKGDWLYFHWKTILLPAHIAEYVVVHEMAHLHEPHHTPEFWRRVERAMPDFQRRKSWLATHGMDVEVLKSEPSRKAATDCLESYDFPSCLLHSSPETRPAYHLPECMVFDCIW